MDPLAIPVIGLALALVAALLVIRRRDDELERLRARASAPRRDTAQPSVVPDTSLSEFYDMLPIGHLHVTADGHVDRANVRAHALLGVAPRRLEGRSLMETFLDTRVERQLDAVPPGGNASGEIRTGDGEPRTILYRAYRPADAGLHVLLEDVSELRRLQQIRTEFIDNLGHELRTPLTTVSLLAETLARDAEGEDVPPRMKDRIAKIEVETGHLVQMVSEMLDLARIEGGSQLRLEDDVDLGRLAEAAIERLRLFAERQGVTLVVDVEPGLPTVRGDEARLGQVFINLVHNAVKFSPDGGEVLVRVRVVGEAAVASVIDHGIGIAPADRARVFERFYKVDRARVRGGGTGLGLSIARNVVQGHGGRIWAESTARGGSTFLFTIPLVARTADAADAPALPDEPASDTAEAPSGAPTPS